MSDYDNKVIAFAIHDALVNVCQPKERVASVYGPRPTLDGSINEEQAKHIGILNERHFLGEVRGRTKEIVERAHDVIGEPVQLLVAKVVVGGVAEVIASSLALYSAGTPFPENFLYGCGCAGLMFALVGFTRHANKAVRYSAVAVLIVLALGLTTMRMNEVGVSRDASPLTSLALPVILLLGTFGIAVLTEPSVTKLRTFWPHWRKAREATRELAAREGRDAEAQEFTDDLARQRVAHENGCVRGEALYTTTWKAKRAEIEGSDPTRTN
jgi:hypothetical protein